MEETAYLGRVNKALAFSCEFEKTVSAEPVEARLKSQRNSC